MNKKQKLTAFALSMSLLSGSTALAYSGAPASQFGFRGWPYRQNSSCYSQPAEPQATSTPAVTCTPQPTATPVPTPVSTPVATSTPQPTATPAPTAKPTATKKPAATTPPSNGDDYTTPSISAQEEKALNLLNQDRIANGLPALTLDPVLSSIARAKSKDMNDNRYFSHTSPTYGTASQMLKHFGYSFTSVGENIAHHATVEKSQAAFMSSDGHRRNALGSQWTKVGIGVWTDAQGFVYVTQLFVR